ncbi:hypothetical protein [Butyrivibrio sp. AE2015]|uniref:hypothetical protein n=1 Tax=Butyrivibrio sp. AE2015 TaxID=1280663 RepID=UPI0012DF7D13|nr:hypothetical protein [Butyrivibrio sp. AE2015]
MLEKTERIMACAGFYPTAAKRSEKATAKHRGETMPNKKNTDKNKSETAARPEIKLKSNPKADAMKKAPDEVIAMAIREALIKDKENR